jgi:hypothetical protein
MLWFRLKHGARVRRRLAKAIRGPISSLEDDVRGCVVGEVQPQSDLVTAPISGKPCVHWVVSIHEVGAVGDWVAHGSVDQGVPFLIKDASGQARIVANGARVDLPSTSILRFPYQGWARHEQALFKDSKSKFNWPRTSNARFNEYRIEVGQKIVVLGNSTREPTDETEAESGYRAGPRTRPVLSNARWHPLLIGIE